jgi:prepilin-type N-terminal cleavage/methylation domain-containing protein
MSDYTQPTQAKRYQMEGLVMQKYSTHKNISGFTLIELLIVIAIIGILIDRKNGFA